MTRIIAGSAGGRRIKAPPGDSTRPTSDRVREALFSAIDSALGSLAGLRFLDVYAGSGAVGLEARSRGAGVVTLVEHDRRTARLIRDNARVLGFDGVEVLHAPAARALRQPPRAPYDVVFLDPPYAVPADEVAEVLAGLRDHDWLAPGALVVVERSGRGADLVWPEGFVGERTKSYGETTLWYGHAAVTPR
ncbi:MAG: 16S rRNA (guanine(966)-N(2))-methyltransferase RsmD [Nocardioidaceae bacterium]|nr:16S rRNA (guanine(966)-N(2))-methyltransferase RsmD [Nocardioidaceae bacterium]